MVSHSFLSACRLLKGYTCVAVAERSSRLCLAAGTASGRVEFLDAATAALTASMLAAPGDVSCCPVMKGHTNGLQGSHACRYSSAHVSHPSADHPEPGPGRFMQGSTAVSALHPCSSSLGSPLLAVGFDSGAATLLDTRCGGLVAAWPAHSERVTSLASDGHRLVSASQVCDRQLAGAGKARAVPWTLHDDLSNGSCRPVACLAARS